MSKIAVPHDVEVEVIVLALNAKGRPSLVEHRCKVCGRLVSGRKH